jgi:hypothetical protein
MGSAGCGNTGPKSGSFFWFFFSQKKELLTFLFDAVISRTGTDPAHGTM